MIHRKLSRRIFRAQAITVVSMMIVLGGSVRNVAEPLAPPQFFVGSAIRVIPNDYVEIKWVADVSWRGFVELFEDPDGEGPLSVRVDSVDGAGAPIIGTDHDVRISVALLQPDHLYFARITMTDPGGGPLQLITETPLPQLFTGVQAIGDVVINAGLDSATIAWDANVIGLGRVSYGQTTPEELGAVHDQENTTAHSIQLTGLSPGTTYRFRVSNHHAIDGDSLADMTGLFTTQTPVATAVLRQGLAEPRVIDPGEDSTLSVRVLQNNQAFAGATVRFEILSESHGSATLRGGGSSAEAISDGAGKATMLVHAVSRGLLRVEASSAAATNRVVIPVVVRGS